MIVCLETVTEVIVLSVYLSLCFCLTINVTALSVGQLLSFITPKSPPSDCTHHSVASPDFYQLCSSQLCCIFKDSSCSCQIFKSDLFVNTSYLISCNLIWKVTKFQFFSNHCYFFYLLAVQICRHCHSERPQTTEFAFVLPLMPFLIQPELKPSASGLQDRVTDHWAIAALTFFRIKDYNHISLLSFTCHFLPSEFQSD